MDHHLTGPDCETDIERLGERLVRVRRTVRRAGYGGKVEVFGSAWGFVIGRHLRRGQVTAQVGRDELSFLGESASFFPPFSVVEWRFTPGEIALECYFSTAPVPPDLPDYACAFPGGGARPRTVEDVFHRVRAAKDRVDLSRSRQPSAVAARAKALIDATYDSELSIEGVATHLGFPYSSMNRAFREAYGLPPVRYRTKLRIWKALESLFLARTSIADAAFLSGFGNLSQFYRQFRRETSVAPSRLSV